jgi:hypothetical protein
MDHLGLASERILSNQTDPWNQPLKYCQSNKPAGMANHMKPRDWLKYNLETGY